MTEFRDHQPIVIEEFNGLWKRGDADSTPQDHFSDCNNIAFIQGGFRTRDGIDTYTALPDAVRLYTFTKQFGQSLIVLDSSGNFWDTDFLGSPILTIPSATDFGFVSYAGRGYITPTDGLSGIPNEFVYVYLGDGTAARKAAGEPPVDADGALSAANSGSAGNVEAGIHIFAVVYETDTGFLSQLGPDTLPFVTAPGGEGVNLTNVPVSPSPYVVKRHVVATKFILPADYTGDTRGYQFFFVPDAIIANNTGTTITVSFFDSELLEDASYLLDILPEIPAGLGLSTYHNRLISYGEYGNASLIRISAPGEPEAFDAVSGLVIFPLDGQHVQNVQEFRDVMYGFKITKTNAWTDNGDVPSSWPMTVLDQGLGSVLHGVTKVLDSEGVNVDYLIVAGYSGIYLFNGAYQSPELSYKIKDFWLALDRSKFIKLQSINDTILQIVYIVLGDGTMLIVDWSNGLTFKDVRFSPWTFDINIRAVTLIDQNNLIIASDGTEVG